MEHPHYTRPSVWEDRAVPEVLRSGDHARIAAWRRAEAERITKERRPDLWRAHLDRLCEDGGTERPAPPEQSDARRDAATKDAKGDAP